MEALLQPPEFSPVKWLEGASVDDSAPEYLMPSQRRRDQLSDAHYSTLEVRIGDLGGDTTINLWTLGCLVKVFELATNEPPFPLDTFDLTREEMDNDHLSLVEQRLGPNNQKDGDFV
ncbi:hypothetical protein AbraIFM66950_000910 [Aspergillus brasiliensis]|nr:hypothetical protein AbraIFM66950_000910 [Aspergillus brasiliensis]